MNYYSGITHLNIFVIPFEGEEEIVETNTTVIETTETHENNNENNNDNKNVEKKPENKNGQEKNKKTFTQEEFNKALADDRRKHQRNRDELLRQLNDIRENATLTTKQKEDLEGRIEQLQNETLSAQELAKRDREKIQKEYEKEREKLNKEKDYWKTTYHTEKVERELLDASISNKAVNPQQLAAILKPSSKLVEVLKEGKPTGIWETRVTLHDKGEGGEAILLELPATEAVKRMSEMKEHWNLFNSGANSGIAGFTIAGGTTLRGTRPPKDPKDYVKWRAENVKDKK